MNLCIVDNLTNLKSRPYDVYSMSLIQYNANTGGSNVGDCVCRAISTAFNINYNEVRKYLNQYKKELRVNTYKSPIVFSHVIEELGGSSEQKVSNMTTVEQFVDDHNNNDAYILLVGKSNDESSHLVSCRGGNLFDSWDCSQYLVNGYYKVPSSCFGETLELTDIKDYFKQFANENIQNCIKQYWKWIESKWFINYDDEDHYYKLVINGIFQSSYTINTNLTFSFITSDEKQKNWSFKIAYAFTPYMTYDEGVEFINEQTKKRMYEKFYTIHKSIDEYEEELSNISEEDVADTVYYGYDVSAEEKFLNSLPSWVQLRCKSIDIRQARGSGYRSEYNYQLVCKPLAGDENKKDITFYGPTADCIKTEIKWYQEDFLRPDEDYGVDYDGINEW